MKLSIFVFFCICLLTGCSAHHPIHRSEDNGLKKLTLIQTPESYFLNEKADLTARAGLKVSTAYWFEEKAEARPMVTLDFKIDNPQKVLNDSIAFISLDNENIQLYALQGRYVIPENLWVPIVHSHTIQFLLNTNLDNLVLKLNERQQDQLIDFFNRAILMRDAVFPALPPGKKKW